MRPGTADAEPVERRDIKIAGEIRVRSAAGAFMREINSELPCEASRDLVERHRLGIGLPHGPRDAARDDEAAGLIVAFGQRQHALYAAVEVGLPLGHRERLALPAAR